LPPVGVANGLDAKFLVNGAGGGCVGMKRLIISFVVEFFSKKLNNY
jgi:hypothetical protein